jgi:hypothetical protein
LRRVQNGELPGAATLQSTRQPPAPPAAPPPLIAPGSYTFQLQIPIEITVKIGNIAMPPGLTGPAGAVPVAIDGHESALNAVRGMLAGNSDVVDIRLGYRFKRGWITDERVVVVEVKEKLSVSELQKEGKPMIPAEVGGIGVDVRTASLIDQLEHVGVDLSFTEAVPRPGQYREPTDFSLSRFNEPMHVIFHVSPDHAFPELKAFFGRVKRHLTATMYEWDAEHISNAIEQAMQHNNSKLKMVTQRQGTKEAVEDMVARIGNKFEHAWASVGGGKLFPSAYHIKVASRDGEECWVSSGNWKPSNQDDIDPATEHSTSITPLRKHNREWHAIIAHPGIAELFQRYIEFDFDEAQRVPLEEGVEIPLPDIFVPEAIFTEGLERAARARYFLPLTIDRKVDIQPLLTPDRDSRGRRVFLDTAIRMIKRGTEKVYVQNQSFNLLSENNEQFEEFFGALRDKQAAGLDVRVIFRDGREFGAANGPKQQKLLERLKDFGFDTDFIRVQRGCHTKGIIIDSSEVMLGSQNLTNEGSLFNRDASLLVRDPEVAAYFEKIFLFDWDTLATQEVDEIVGGVRLARADEATPVGFRRVSLYEFLGES